TTAEQKPPVSVHFATPANAAGQSGTYRKRPEPESPPISSGLFAFVSVTVCAGLLVFTGCWPKSRLAGESPALGGDTTKAYAAMLLMIGVADIPTFEEALTEVSSCGSA